MSLLQKLLKTHAVRWVTIKSYNYQPMMGSIMSVHKLKVKLTSDIVKTPGSQE